VIEVNERIEVPAPARTVWALLSDPHAVVDCVPGAALGEQHEDGSFDATLMVKFGPAKVTFRARVAVEFDEAAMTGRVISKGKDNQGGTRFNASMGFKVVEQAGSAGSVVPVDAQVDIAGRLASLVESGATLVVKRMTAEFSERLAARCSGENQAREEG
jgi:carbon monoxide dehydrogenase subunit G